MENNNSNQNYQSTQPTVESTISNQPPILPKKKNLSPKIIIIIVLIIVVTIGLILIGKYLFNRSPNSHGQAIANPHVKLLSKKSFYSQHLVGMAEVSLANNSKLESLDQNERLEIMIGYDSNSTNTPFSFHSFLVNKVSAAEVENVVIDSSEEIMVSASTSTSLETIQDNQIEELIDITMEEQWESSAEASVAINLVEFTDASQSITVQDWDEEVGVIDNQDFSSCEGKIIVSNSEVGYSYAVETDCAEENEENVFDIDYTINKFGEDKIRELHTYAVTDGMVAIGEVDFNPLAATYNLSSTPEEIATYDATGNNLMVIKYNEAGEIEWQSKLADHTQDNINIYSEISINIYFDSTTDDNGFYEVEDGYVLFGIYSGLLGQTLEKNHSGFQELYCRDVPSEFSSHVSFECDRNFMIKYSKSGEVLSYQLLPEELRPFSLNNIFYQDNQFYFTFSKAEAINDTYESVDYLLVTDNNGNVITQTKVSDGKAKIYNLFGVDDEHYYFNTIDYDDYEYYDDDDYYRVGVLKMTHNGEVKWHSAINIGDSDKRVDQIVVFDDKIFTNVRNNIILIEDDYSISNSNRYSDLLVYSTENGEFLHQFNYNNTLFDDEEKQLVITDLLVQNDELLVASRHFVNDEAYYNTTDFVMIDRITADLEFKDRTSFATYDFIDFIFSQSDDREGFRSQEILSKDGYLWTFVVGEGYGVARFGS